MVLSRVQPGLVRLARPLTSESDGQVCARQLSSGNPLRAGWSQVELEGQNEKSGRFILVMSTETSGCFSLWLPSSSVGSKRSLVHGRMMSTTGSPCQNFLPFSFYFPLEPTTRMLAPSRPLDLYIFLFWVPQGSPFISGYFGQLRQERR